MNKFKDILVRNKYKLYQNMVKNMKEQHYNVKNHIKLSTIDYWEHPWGYRFNGCGSYNCYQSSCCYHPGYIKNNIKYDNFIHEIKLDKLDKIKIKESLWFVYHTNEYSFNIGGNFDIKTCEDGKILYTPISPYSLTLNNIPVSFIYRSLHNGAGLLPNDDRVRKSTKLYFMYDLSSYCKMISYVLKCKKYKYSLFRYLPMEIIEHILLFTSLI